MPVAVSPGDYGQLETDHHPLHNLSQQGEVLFLTLSPRISFDQLYDLFIGMDSS